MTKEPVGSTGELVTRDPDTNTRLRITIGRLSRLLRRASGEAPLTATEAAVLSTTARMGPVGLGRLACEEAMNPTMLSRVVRTLEGAGLLVREEDRTDRRAAKVELSAKGHQLVTRMRDEKADALGRALERLGEADRAVLVGALPVLEALAEALREDHP